MQIALYGPTGHVDRLANILKNDYNVKIINLSKIIRLHMNKNNNIHNKIRLIIEISKYIYNVKLIYAIFAGNLSILNLSIFIIAKLLNKPIINHWIGTDVIIAKKNKNKAKIMQLFITYNYSGNKLLYDELYEIGIKSEIVPIILQDISHTISKMPDCHAILVYLPKGREIFYGYDIVIKLIEIFKSINFYIVGDTDLCINNKENVILLGKVEPKDMEKIYDKVSILLRIPEHDGLSLMLLEALAKGKNVIYKYEFPYVYLARNFIEAEEALKKIIAEGPPSVNLQASKFIRENYTQDKYIMKIMEKIND